MRDAPQIIDLSANHPQKEEFRHGQWIKFNQDFALDESAHLTPDGKYLGIYQRPQLITARSLDTPEGRVEIPEKRVPEVIVVIKKNGNNLMWYDQETDKSWVVAFSPTVLTGIEPAKIPDDLPMCPKTKHLFGK